MEDIEQYATEDRRIEKTAENATLRLMEHRAKAVELFGVREYARAIDRHHTTVLQYAKAWEMWGDGGRAPTARPEDILRLARMGEDRQAATQAVAQAKGVTVGTAERHHPTEVKRVRQAIADAPPEARAEKAHKVARQIESTRQKQSEHTEQRRSRPQSSWFDLEREIDKARRALTVALTIARESKLEGEYVELAQDSLGKVRALMGLIDLAITGTIEVDWDAEMRKVTADET